MHLSHFARALKVGLCSLSLLTTTLCHSEFITWRSPAGELSTMYVCPNDTFLGVISQIRDQFEDSLALGHSEPAHSEFLIDFSIAPSPSAATVKAIENMRIYTPLSKSEQKDIAYIVTTLGNASITSIAGAKSSLKKAGDRIEMVHPMQFLLYVFSDEKLKAAMHNLQDRTSWIRNEFFNGIIRSFDEEAARNNLSNHIDDFATRLNLDYGLIASLITEKRWKDLINTLYTQLPRQGETDRYNM